MGPLRAVPPPAAQGADQGAEPPGAGVARIGADFEGLYRRYYPVIQRYVRRRLGDPHAVEDLVAETFLVAYEQRDRYRDRGLPIQAWLYRLATSRLARRQRARLGLFQRHLRKRRPEPSDTVREAPADEPDQARRELVREAIAALEVRYQDVLALHHLEGLSLDEVAAVLRCRVGTVKSRLFRAREALRLELERREWSA